MVEDSVDPLVVVTVLPEDIPQEHPTPHAGCLDHIKL
jgi:hypothetical protein